MALKCLSRKTVQGQGDGEYKNNYTTFHLDLIFCDLHFVCGQAHNHLMFI